MIDVIVPFEQEGTKAVVRAWLKAVGDAVVEHEPLVELETDKVTQEVPAPASGVLDEILLGTDAEAMPGVLLGRIRPGVAAVVAAVAEVRAPVGEVVVPAPAKAGEGRFSPSVRRAVGEHGLDAAVIAGTGRGGRVTRADVDRVVAARAGQVDGVAPVKESTPPSIEAAGPVSGAVRSRSVPHDRMRRLIADNMLNSVTVAPHVTAVFEADLSAVVAHRAAHKAAFERDGVHLTYTAYMVAACVEAMRAAPAINSRWHADLLELFEDVNIGVGTAIGDKGLVVPVIHRAQDLSLAGIAARLTDLTARARAGGLRPADVLGGTFSISNHGVSGSLLATPIIIQQPQSAILGVGKLEKRVVAREVGGVDTIQIRPMCYVSLTIDHRVVDAHQTNRWLSRFVEAIEDWRH